jgi:hypothetical protein
MSPCPRCGAERPGYHRACPQCGFPPHFPMHYSQVLSEEEIAELAVEDIQRDLGLEKMSFVSEMLRPDAEDEREEDINLPTAPTSEEDILTPEHQRAIVERLEQYFGRKPTQQEINLALDQARSV